MNVQSQGGNLAKVRSFVAGVAKECGFDDNVVYDIKVAVGEAIANAVEHGSPLGEANHVKVTCQCDGDDLVVKISDEGIFKRALPIPEGAVSYRGHGILLMLALMDKVSIDESEHGTTVSLTKNLRSKPNDVTQTA